MEAPVNMRCCILDGLDREIVATVQRVVSRVNSFVEMFLRGGEFIRNREVQSVQLAIHKFPGIDLRIQNLPTRNEVVAVLLDDNTGAERDISHQRGGGLYRISVTHPATLPAAVRTW